MPLGRFSCDRIYGAGPSSVIPAPIRDQPREREKETATVRSVALINSRFTLELIPILARGQRAIFSHEGSISDLIIENLARLTPLYSPRIKFKSLFPNHLESKLFETSRLHVYYKAVGAELVILK